MGEGVKGGAFRGVNVCEGVVEDDGCGDRGWRRPLLEDGAVVGGEHKQQLVQHRERSLSLGRPLKRPEILMESRLALAVRQQTRVSSGFSGTLRLHHTARRLDGNFTLTYYYTTVAQSLRQSALPHSGTTAK